MDYKDTRRKAQDLIKMIVDEGQCGFVKTICIPDKIMEIRMSDDIRIMWVNMIYLSAKTTIFLNDILSDLVYFSSVG